MRPWRRRCHQPRRCQLDKARGTCRSHDQPFGRTLRPPPQPRGFRTALDASAIAAPACCEHNVAVSGLAGAPRSHCSCRLGRGGRRAARYGAPEGVVESLARLEAAPVHNACSFTNSRACGCSVGIGPRSGEDVPTAWIRATMRATPSTSCGPARRHSSSGLNFFASGNVSACGKAASPRIEPSQPQSSARLSQTPASVWGFVDQRAVRLEDVGDVQSALQVVWQLQALAGFQRIWQWRHGQADTADPWTAAAALSAFRSSQIAAIHKAVGCSHARSKEVVHSICRGLLHFLALPHPVSSTAPVSTGRFLLFFDGGSRGNPGPGGAGAVVVHVDAFGCSERIVGSAAMSLANAKTTNNHAEYVGLVSGLRAAQASSWRPLTVIGGSAMILSQLRDSRPPRHPRLRRLYGRARILADSVGVETWVHRFRAYNKMADAAANIAMDARASAQTLHPTSRPIWQVLHAHLQGDLNQWRVSTYPDQPSSG